MTAEKDLKNKASQSTFQPIDTTKSIDQNEVETQRFWEEHKIFEASIADKSDDDEFVFYDGPPFATGLPHYGHIVASTLKDVVPRYWAMKGKKVERRFGWDTHGLPIEMLVEKELGLNGPTEVKEYGVAQFNEACRSNVLNYASEWRKTISRLGRWVDFDDDYKTMDLPFMESVWWVFSRLWDKGLVYQGSRVMPFSWRLSTPLSNFEANLDYRDVDDPAITVALKSLEDDSEILIWTTTPWTLPSNLAAAVGVDIGYALVKVQSLKEHLNGRRFWLAQDRIAATFGSKALEEGHIEIIQECPGSELLGKKYTPLFPYFKDTIGAFKIIAADHVTTESGTGIVHMAPAFGEDDFTACEREGIPPIDPVDLEGKFTEAVSDYVGVNIKDADKDIIKRLKDESRLIRHDTYRHSYPFCWRSGTPLIYKTVPVWFVKVEELRDRMVEHNQSIHWVPEAIGQKRFGNWLANARDWAISRNRFWGTPIPIWHCEACDSHECIGSASELSKRLGREVEDLHPHKIEDAIWPCPTQDCPGQMVRIEEVFDCWFESGAMPYAQVHYPFENKERFDGLNGKEGRFPADFIAEGLDQTRGWFYTLLVLSTALFDKPPFKNVIVNGMVLAEDGSKMSKSKKNYPDPTGLIEQYGADALRAYLISSPVVKAEPVKFSESDVRDVIRTVVIPMQNAWSFFTQYAIIDGWSPQDIEQAQPTSERAAIDRWILSELERLVTNVNENMEGYYLYKVVPDLLTFIDDLTNWYIRRSRRRFWRSAEDSAGQQDKQNAYATLYDVLVTFSKLMAPVMPFLAERMYQHLVVATGLGAERTCASVHLERYPERSGMVVEHALLDEMKAVRQIVFMGRQLRERHKLKTRQPLASVTVVCDDEAVRDGLRAHEQLIAEELNVKSLIVQADDSQLSDVEFKPNFKTLGRRLGKDMKLASQAISELTREGYAELKSGGRLDVSGHEITDDDIMVQRTPKEGVVLASEGNLVVALDSDLSESLIHEGLARELISHVQKKRKDAGFDVVDRIQLTVDTASESLVNAVHTNKNMITDETLATSFIIQHTAETSEEEAIALTDSISVSIGLEKAS